MPDHRLGRNRDGEADVEESVNRTELANLEYFGYGVSSFALSLIETAVELTDGRITGRDVRELGALAREMVSEEIELFGVPHARRGAWSDEALRVIAENREWVRNYQVRLALITNPKTPLPIALRHVPSLDERDVRMLSRSDRRDLLDLDRPAAAASAKIRLR